MSRTVTVAAIAMLLAACAGQPVETVRQTRPVESTARTESPVRDDTGSRRSDAGNAVTRLALSLVGTPYVFGGETPAGFDCSGLVFYTYVASGFDVPRTSLAQYRSARKIALADATPGDLVFFQDQAQLSHVGIYLGADRFVHAPATGRTVSIARLSEPYYQKHLVGVGRLARL
jgi:cell wall-associated NlpC family hydrolase